MPQIPARIHFLQRRYEVILSYMCATLTPQDTAYVLNIEREGRPFCLMCLKHCVATVILTARFGEEWLKFSAVEMGGHMEIYDFGCLTLGTVRGLQCAGTSG